MPRGLPYLAQLHGSEQNFSCNYSFFYHELGLHIRIKSKNLVSSVLLLQKICCMRKQLTVQFKCRRASIGGREQHISKDLNGLSNIDSWLVVQTGRVGKLGNRLELKRKGVRWYIKKQKSVKNLRYEVDRSGVTARVQ